LICPLCGETYQDSVAFCPKDGAALTSGPNRAADDLIGETVSGRFVIKEKIGSGGMGVVYRAHQHMVDRDVALKILPQSFAGDHAAERRFFNEARAISKLRHRNIVTLFDFGRTNQGDLYIAMEYVAGRPLSRVIREGPMELELAIHVTREVCLALQAAHENKIVHRDIKPDNIMLVEAQDGGRPQVRVLDFGIAKEGGDTARLTKTGIVFGTPEYFSPEQARGIQTDGRSDIYSVGCVLWEMLAGRRPFSGSNAAAIVYQHIHEPPPSLRAEFPMRRYPKDLDEFVR